MVAAMVLLSSSSTKAFTTPIRRSFGVKTFQTSKKSFVSSIEATKAAAACSTILNKPLSTCNRHSYYNSNNIYNPTKLFMSTTTTAEEKTSSSTTISGVDSKYDISNKEKGIIGKYEPQLFESDIYKWWEDAGCFQPDAKQSKEEAKANGREPYVLPMPPPNVTGRLHMGHAIFVALQDVLARFHRMRGRPVLWLPGKKKHLCYFFLYWFWNFWKIKKIISHFFHVLFVFERNGSCWYCNSITS